MIVGATLEAKTLSRPGHIRVAIAHNRRTVTDASAGSIDTSRSYANERIAGPPSPDEAVKHANAMMKAAGLGKVRKNGVRALEFLVTLPAGHHIEERAFFVAAVEWLALRFGGTDNILGADIHRDEAAPHLHLLLLPLIGGRMVGSAALGGRPKLLQLHADFFTAVCEPYGLQRYAMRLTGKNREALADAALAEIRRLDDPALKSLLWPVVRSQIEADPIPAARALGVTANVYMKPKKVKTMTAIFISKGKGSQTPDIHETSIGVVGPKRPELLSVGVPQKAVSPKAVSRLTACIRKRLPITSAPRLFQLQFQRSDAYMAARARPLPAHAVT